VKTFLQVLTILFTALEAVGTISAAVIALAIASWQELRRRVIRPDLELRIAPTSPDCVKIPTLSRQRITADAYYIRARVANTGNRRADNVEVYAAGLLRRQSDGSFTKEKDFLPMSMTWAHTEDIVLPAILPGAERYCGIASVFDPALRAKFPAQDREFPDVPREATILSLQTKYKVNDRNYLLPPGTYRLVLELAAENVRPIRYSLEITVTGKWFDDEAQMLDRGIDVKVVP